MSASAALNLARQRRTRVPLTPLALYKLTSATEQVLHDARLAHTVVAEQGRSDGRSRRQAAPCAWRHQGAARSLRLSLKALRVRRHGLTDCINNLGFWRRKWR